MKRIFTTGEAFAAVKADGSIVTWGHGWFGGDSSAVASELSSGVTKIIPNDITFAAIKENGSVITWGDDQGKLVWNSLKDTLKSGVANVVAGYQSFAALKTDGSVITWGFNPVPWGGHQSYGPEDEYYIPARTDVSSQLTSGVKEIVTNGAGTYAALKTNGSVVTWGISVKGGDHSAVAEKLTSGVVKVVPGMYTYGALKEDGSVVVWGHPDNYGYGAFGTDVSAVSDKISSGVKTLYTSAGSFAALKEDGSVVTWGNVRFGGDSSAVAHKLSSGVSEIVNAGNGFCALKEDGSVIYWGKDIGFEKVSSQLQSEVKKIVGTYQDAWAALKEDGSVVTWGWATPTFDGQEADIYSSNISTKLSSDVKDIKSLGYSIAAIKNDGSAVIWGQTADYSSHANELSSGVVEVFSNNMGGIYAGHAVLKEDGRVITWGKKAHFGADSSSVASATGYLELGKKVTGTDQNETITGGTGPDVLSGGNGTDTITGAEDNDNLSGGAGNDVLNGGTGNDIISGGTGSDIIKGNEGDDKIYLEADGVWATSIDKDGKTVVPQAWNVNSSKIIFEKVSIVGKNKFEDVIEGNNGNDTLELTTSSDAFFLHDTLSAFNSTLTLADDAFGQKNIDRLISIETINGGDGDDLIDLTSPDTQISDAMIVNAGIGNDIIWSSAGTDTLNGGDGNDVLFGGKGIDTLTGGNGSDTFEFCNQSGNDIIKDYNKADGDKLAFHIQNGDNQNVSFSGDTVNWGSLSIQLEGLIISSENDFIAEFNIVA